MARPTRRIATTPKGVREKIKNASQYNLNLIKEIEASYRSKLDPGAEAKLADEKSIYPEWRGFLAAYRGPSQMSGMWRQTLRNGGAKAVENSSGRSVKSHS